MLLLRAKRRDSKEGACELSVVLRSHGYPSSLLLANVFNMI